LPSISTLFSHETDARTYSSHTQNGGCDFLIKQEKSTHTHTHKYIIQKKQVKSTHHTPSKVRSKWLKFMRKQKIWHDVLARDKSKIGSDSRDSHYVCSRDSLSIIRLSSFASPRFAVFVFMNECNKSTNVCALFVGSSPHCTFYSKGRGKSNLNLWMTLLGRRIIIQKANMKWSPERKQLSFSAKGKDEFAFFFLWALSGKLTANLNEVMGVSHFWFSKEQLLEKKM